jgi:hypothetical protein
MDSKQKSAVVVPGKFAKYQFTQRAYRAGYEHGWDRATAIVIDRKDAPLDLPSDQSQEASTAFLEGNEKGYEDFLKAHEMVADADRAR